MKIRFRSERKISGPQNDKFVKRSMKSGSPDKVAWLCVLNTHGALPAHELHYDSPHGDSYSDSSLRNTCGRVSALFDMHYLSF